MIGPMLRVLVVGLVLLVGVMFATASLKRSLPEPELATYLATPLELPDFELTDTNGAAFSRDDLGDRFTLMFFGFTNCPDICPLTLAALAGAHAQLGADAERPQVVFVSVDPNRDTPERIATYLAGFDTGFIGVTGSQARLEPLLRALGVTVMIQEFPDRPGYSVTHNGTIYMIGPHARLVATLGGSPPSAAIASDFRRVRALDRRRLAASPDG